MTLPVFVLTYTHSVKVFYIYSGVYISVYSDCLDPNRWYHGKSGYIAIIRLTKVLKKAIVKYSSVIVFSFKENILRTKCPKI